MVKKNPLVVLGFKPSDKPSADELKQAHRKKMREQYHTAQKGDVEATKKLAEINAAYHFLTKGPGAQKSFGSSFSGSIFDFLNREEKRAKQQQDKPAQKPAPATPDPDREKDMEEGFSRFLEVIHQFKPKFNDLAQGGGALFDKALEAVNSGADLKGLKERARRVTGYLASGELEKKIGHGHSHMGRAVSVLATQFGKALDKKLGGADDEKPAEEQQSPDKKPKNDLNQSASPEAEADAPKPAKPRSRKGGNDKKGPGPQ